MKTSRIVILAVIVLIFIVSGAFFVVEEGEQAIVTQFGRPIDQPIQQAGLNFKIPLVQKVHFFEKKLLKWDGSPNQIPTRDKKYIWVDTTARWKIVDPLRFLQTVASERGALSRLDDIIDSVVRDLVSSNLLVELVRSAEFEYQPDRERASTLAVEPQTTDEADEGADKPVRSGRLGITRQMLAAAQALTPRYGIELIDVRIKRINYVESVRKRVFERMVSERQRIAAQLRSEGEGLKAEILGEMQKQLAGIQSGAYRRAQEVRGKADAEATKIYGQSFGQDPEFYSFTRTLELYQDYPNADSTVILTTESDFYRYLKGVEKD